MGVKPTSQQTYLKPAVEHNSVDFGRTAGCLLQPQVPVAHLIHESGMILYADSTVRQLTAREYLPHQDTLTSQLQLVFSRDTISLPMAVGLFLLQARLPRTLCVTNAVNC